MYFTAARIWIEQKWRVLLSDLVFKWTLWCEQDSCHLSQLPIAHMINIPWANCALTNKIIIAESGIAELKFFLIWFSLHCPNVLEKGMNLSSSSYGLYSRLDYALLLWVTASLWEGKLNLNHRRAVWSFYGTLHHLSVLLKSMADSRQDFPTIIKLFVWALWWLNSKMNCWALTLILWNQYKSLLYI